LAFRGGTALHKLYLKPQIRYSEDIDLVQINPEPINPILKRLRERLAFLGTKRTISRTIFGTTSRLPLLWQSRLPGFFRLRVPELVTYRLRFFQRFTTFT